MQPRGRAAKVRLLVDGKELKGVPKVGQIMGEEGTLIVSELKRKYPIGDGQVEWKVIEFSVLNQASTSSYQFCLDWWLNKELHQVTYQKLDGHNQVYAEWDLPDVELLKGDAGPEFDAESVATDMSVFAMAFYEPEKLS